VTRGGVALAVRQGSDEWLEERQRGIGSSDAPATVDLDPYSSRLEKWALKVGLIDPPQQTPTMRIGKLVEPLIATLYEEQTGRKVRRRLQMLQHAEHPFLRASLDRVAAGRIVELKKSRTGDGYGRPGSDQVPPYVFIQVQHQMLVTRYEVADVAVWVGGEELRRYEVPADRRTQDLLLQRELVFWQCVVDEVSPVAIDGSAATQRYLAARYPEDRGHQLIPDEDLIELAVHLREAREAVVAASLMQTRIENEIKARMGDAALVEGPGFRITWRNPKPSESIDWMAVATEYRDLIDRYEHGQPTPDPSLELEEIVRRHTTAKPGARRFLPTFTGDPA
jgi:putative phage-type endonuclease